MVNEIQIIIADDHPVVRQGLRLAIETDQTLKVVAEVGDGQAALVEIERLRPQVAVLDIDMPRMDGFDLAQAIREKGLPVEIVFLTIHREEELLDRAIEIGAKGYVLKDSAISDIVAAIRAAASGKHYTSPTMTGYLINRRKRAIESTKKKTGLDDLTPTERRVLRLIAEYKTSKEISEALFISTRTVETHRNNISQKLNLHGRHALMKFALAHQAQLTDSAE